MVDLKTVDFAMLFVDIQLSIFGSNSGPARWVVTALMEFVGAVSKEQYKQFQHDICNHTDDIMCIYICPGWCSS